MTTINKIISVMFITSITFAVMLVVLYYIVIPLFPVVNLYYFPQQVGVFDTEKLFLYPHILFGSLALITGSINLSNALRIRKFKYHKYFGRAYLVFVTISAICAMYIAFNAYDGNSLMGRLIVSSGFLTLALLWILTTYSAVYYVALRNDFVSHVTLMVLSFSLTFAAVTLRLEILPLIISGNATGVVFDNVYPLLGWLCWVPNFIVGLYVANKLGKSDFFDRNSKTIFKSVNN